MANSNDSSSDEDVARLREAIDSSMFDTTKAAKDKSHVKEKIITNYKDNILRVTPEFQNFIAERLTRVLDESIKEYTSEVFDEEPDLSGGIKLFHDSERILTDKRFSNELRAIKDGQSTIQKKKKKRPVKDESESESELFEKARSAAVPPEWVINKEGTVGWSKPKGKEIRVKKKSNGEMEIVEPPFVSMSSLSI